MSVLPSRTQSLGVNVTGTLWCPNTLRRDLTRTFAAATLSGLFLFQSIYPGTMCSEKIHHATFLYSDRLHWTLGYWAPPFLLTYFHPTCLHLPLVCAHRQGVRQFLAFPGHLTSGPQTSPAVAAHGLSLRLCSNRAVRTLFLPVLIISKAADTKFLSNSLILCPSGIKLLRIQWRTCCIPCQLRTKHVHGAWPAMMCFHGCSKLGQTTLLTSSFCYSRPHWDK